MELIFNRIYQRTLIFKQVHRTFVGDKNKQSPSTE